MSDSYYGEIRMFGGNYAPLDWAFCNGQLYTVAQNAALYSILGTAYGGDGIHNFALPNLCGRAVMGAGTGPGLTQRYLYQPVGQETVTLTQAEMPNHTHTLKAAATAATGASPENTHLAQAKGKGFRGAMVDKNLYTETPTVYMNPQMLAASGTHAPHENRQPYLALSFILCLIGTYPTRN